MQLRVKIELLESAPLLEDGALLAAALRRVAAHLISDLVAEFLEVEIARVFRKNLFVVQNIVSSDYTQFVL